MLGAGRAVDEIPPVKPPLLTFDDRDAFAAEHEEVLLLGLPVVRRRHLACTSDAERHPEHRKERLRLVLVFAGQRHAPALPGLVGPTRLAYVEHEPAAGRRG